MTLDEALADYSSEYDPEYYDYNDHAEAAHLLAAEVQRNRTLIDRERSRHVDRDGMCDACSTLSYQVNWPCPTERTLSGEA